MELDRELEVVLLGVDFGHPPDLIIARPSGYMDHWIICCFSTPFWHKSSVETANGNPGDCLIFAPGEPHWHGTLVGAETGFRNDWIHFRGSGIQELVDRYDLRTSCILHSGDTQTIRPFLRKIQSELYLCDDFFTHSVRILAKSMFLEIARTTAKEHTVQPSMTPAERELRERFVQLRQEVASNLAEEWPIDEMARRTHMSSSRFYEHYKRFFGVTPREDLLNVRIEHSRRLLSGTNASVATVAQLAGFSSPYYFSRTFHKRVGMTPSDYSRRFGS